MVNPSLLNQFLDPKSRYTFSDYFDLSLASRDIARGFGYSLDQSDDLLLLFRTEKESDLIWLQRTLEVNQRRNPLENEMSRRAAIVSPILTEVCEIADLKLDTEYTISVSPHLVGIVDYQIEAEVSLLIVEAKQSDLVRGFKQLIPELIALHYWSQKDCALLFGCVTDGERWQFALLDRASRVIWQDRRIYLLNALKILIDSLVAIVGKGAIAPSQ